MKPFSQGIPLKRLSDSAIQIGSDARFAKVLYDLDELDIKYLQYLTTTGNMMVKDLKGMDSKRQRELEKLIEDYRNYPFMVSDIEILMRSYVALLPFEKDVLSDFMFEVALTLAKSGVGHLYVNSLDIAGRLTNAFKTQGLATFVITTKPNQIDFAVVECNHAYLANICNNLMILHIPYLVTLLRGSDAIVGPLNVVGETPCINCAAHTFDEDNKLCVSDDAQKTTQFDYSITKHSPSLITTAAGITASKALDFLLFRKYDSELVSIREPGARIAYSEIKVSDKCGCMELK